MSAAILVAAVLTAEEATAEVSAMTQLPMNARKTAQNNCGNLNITIVLEVLLVLLQTWDKLNSRLLGNPDISAQQEPGHSFAHLLIDPTPLCVVTRVNHNKVTALPGRLCKLTQLSDNGGAFCGQRFYVNHMFVRSGFVGCWRFLISNLLAQYCCKLFNQRIFRVQVTRIFQVCLCFCVAAARRRTASQLYVAQRDGLQTGFCLTVFRIKQQD